MAGVIHAGRNVSQYGLHFRFVANRIRVDQQSWTPIYGRPVSVFFGEHDREDAGGFFWVSWIFGTVPHQLIVVVVLEKELLAVNLEAAEVVLLVRILNRPEFAGGSEP